MALQTEKTKLELDGRWGLEELSDTARYYIQLYGFAYLLLPDLPTLAATRSTTSTANSHGVVVTARQGFRGYHT